MAAANCRTCFCELDKKSRRTIFSNTFEVAQQLYEVLGHVPHEDDGLSKYVCSHCYSKLKKLSKIDFDLINKLEELRKEKNELIKSMRANLKSIQTTCTSNSVSDASVTNDINVQEDGSKRSRPILHSPTPRKVKKCKQGFVKTPEKTRKPCIKLFTPSKIKVLFNTGKQIKSRTVKDAELKRVIKAISSGQPKRSIAKFAYNSLLKDELIMCVIHDIKKDIMNLVSKKSNCCLRSAKCENLSNFKFDQLLFEVQLYAPVFYKSLSNTVKGSHEVAVIAAIITRNNNMHMSALHHIIAQVLDHSGATDECISLFQKLGLSVSSSAAAKKKVDLAEYQNEHINSTVINEKRVLETSGTRDLKTSEIIGDNFDISKCPSNMSKEKQRKSLHWFLLIGLQKRIIGNSLSNQPPSLSISDVTNGVFIPTHLDCEFLEQNCLFHMMKIIVKYVACFKKYAPYLPEVIDHPHRAEMSRKSDFVVLDLLDKSENKSEDMISILEHIHMNYIAHTSDERVIQKKVFGGDVLTNERAYSAQLAMMNGRSEFDQLAGVIHRPEGLHRMMNLCLVIAKKFCLLLFMNEKLVYQQFYKPSSAAEVGTLSQLRNFVHRIDVHGGDEVIQKYRAHYAFLMDCLDSFVTGACLHLLEMDDLDAPPSRKQELFDILPPEEKCKFIKQIAKDILDKYINLNLDLGRFEERVQALDVQSQQIRDMLDPDLQKYICVSCGNQYKTVGHLRRHLKDKHLWDFIENDTEEDKKPDRIAIYRASLMKCLLLLKDTNDGYSMGDGDRIMTNAKFQMLLSGVSRHTKYQIWLFRFLAYYSCILSPKDAYEYKWNCTSNLSGGTGRNIPNDNLVEIMVHRLKEKVRSQGANVTFQSAKKAALSLQVQDEIKQNVMKEINIKPKGTTRAETSKKADVELIIDQLKMAEVFDNVPGRQFDAFPNFQDLFSRVKVFELHKWIQSQKERLSYEIV